MRTLDCGGCGATLDVTELAPGTVFSCGSCGASLTAGGEAAAPAAPAAPVKAARRPSAAASRAPAAARPSRRAGAAAGGGAAAAKPKSKGPLLLAAAGGVILLGGGVALLAGGGGGGEPAGEGPGAAPPAALSPEPAKEPEPAKPPEPPPSPEEAAWRAATTEVARLEWLSGALASGKEAPDRAKALHAFVEGKGRKDLARRVLDARLDAEPGCPWANGLLGRTDMGEALRAAEAREGMGDLGTEEAKRILDRVRSGRTWVGGDERPGVEKDLAAVKADLDRRSDPWWKEATAVLRVVENHPAFHPRFTPVLHEAVPPYLVIAQLQQDERAHATVNVLSNHRKFFHCLTKEFLELMGEAELPTPTLGEMGNPVLKAFVFKDRNAFDRWHWDQRWPKDALQGVRAYYAWGSSQFMMMYDTGAPTATQDEDTCTAFHEATHQLVHYYRRYYLTLEDRKADPKAPEVELLDGRLHGETHWFQEGFAEFFGAADRISSQTGEWALLRPYRSRLAEWGDPLLRKTPQWTLEEVLKMPNKMVMAVLAEQKMPGKKEVMNSLFYAQAWSLNHLLYFGKEGKYHDRYLRYVNEEMRCRGSFERFLECMEVGPDEAARAAFLEELGDDWVGHQKSLLRKSSEGR